jgi:hypothetical protein
MLRLHQIIHVDRLTALIGEDISPNDGAWQPGCGQRLNGLNFTGNRNNRNHAAFAPLFVRAWRRDSAGTVDVSITRRQVIVSAS